MYTYIHIYIYRVFLKMGVPKMHGLQGKILQTWMIWRYPDFRKSPFGCMDSWTILVKRWKHLLPIIDGPNFARKWP